jgi:hypothetical protein
MPIARRAAVIEEHRLTEEDEWALYRSLVNAGQVFYGFGWESLLLEAGLFATFAGGSATAPSNIWIWIYRWMLFRVMFGAGLIKLRGDECWRDLTCLHYYFATQPIPNPLSWYFHWLPHAVHRAGVALNHAVELGVPFLSLRIHIHDAGGTAGERCLVDEAPGWHVHAARVVAEPVIKCANGLNPGWSERLIVGKRSREGRPRRLVR